jgi:hypothetical protein
VTLLPGLGGCRSESVFPGVVYHGHYFNNAFHIYVAAGSGAVLVLCGELEGLRVERHDYSRHRYFFDLFVSRRESLPQYQAIIFDYLLLLVWRLDFFHLAVHIL